MGQKNEEQLAALRSKYGFDQSLEHNFIFKWSKSANRFSDDPVDLRFDDGKYSGYRITCPRGHSQCQWLILRESFQKNQVRKSVLL
jgi:hypothetical protein